MAGARKLSDEAAPAVSVVIPAYNRRDQISAAVDCVLAQTFADFELIVVDDASTDDTPAIVSAVDDSRLRLIRLDPNRGPGGARNAGARAARGEWLAFLDSDDSWRPQKLERQLDFMRRNGLTVSVAAFDIHRRAGRAGTVRLTDKGALSLPDLIEHPGLCIGTTMMIRRDVFEEIGGFDESMRRLEDWEWLLRVGQSRDISVLKDVLADHRAPARRSGAGEETARAADAILTRHRTAFSRRSPVLGRRLAAMAALHRANGYRLAARRVGMIRALIDAVRAAPGYTAGYVWRRMVG